MNTSTQPIPSGREHMIAHLVCSPCAEAIEFYKKAFSAVELCRILVPGDPRIMHAELQLGPTIVFLNDDFPEMCGGKVRSPKALGGTPVGLHRYVVDCDAAMKQAVDAGAEVVMPAADMFWGDRYGLIIDPFGHQWSFATHLHDLTPEAMASAMEEACNPA